MLTNIRYLFSYRDFCRQTIWYEPTYARRGYKSDIPSWRGLYAILDEKSIFATRGSLMHTLVHQKLRHSWPYRATRAAIFDALVCALVIY